MSVEAISLTTNVQVGISIVVLVFWALKNTLSLQNQGTFATITAVILMIGNIAIPSILILRAPSLSSKEFIFSEYFNLTGFDSVAFVSILGTLMGPLTIVGYEGSASLAEETVAASTSVPIAMIKNVAFSAVGGFITILATLAVVQNDIAQVINGPTSMPVMNIFALAFTTNSDNGTATLAPIYPVLLTIFLVFLNFINGFCKMTTTTRIVYALGRDGGLPVS